MIGILLIVGMLLLYAGAEVLVRGASSLALRCQISPLLIGLTVVAFGTSSPELVVNVKAAFTGHGDISLGNIIGSNIFNVAGILSFCALFRAIPLAKQVVRFDLPVMLVSFLLFSLFLWSGTISRWMGVVFVCLVILYTFLVYFLPKRKAFAEKEAKEEVETPLRNIGYDVLYIVGGLLFLVYGGELVVKEAIVVAQRLGISEAAIALGMVSIGTGLPEVSCGLVAFWRKKYDLLVGNIIGSNIFNIFFVLGVSATIRPVIAQNIHGSDLFMMLFSGLFLWPLGQKKEGFFPRWKGYCLMALYLVYLSSLYVLDKSDAAL